MEERLPIEVLFFDANDKGRDYIVGDIHGCMSELMQLLERVSFNPQWDRLFCVGDLADRGPDSREVVNLLVEEPWFYSTMGNHDMALLYAICSFFEKPNDIDRWIDIGPEHQETYLEILRRNHAEWALPLLKEGDDWLVKVAAKMIYMPNIIAVGQPPIRFNVVHSGLFREEFDPVTDAHIDYISFGEEEQQEEWCQYMTNSRWIGRMPEDRPKWQDGLSLTYCGHTPVFQPVRAYSHMNIDTGSGHTPESNNPLRMTLIDHRAERIYSVDTQTRKPSALMNWISKAVISESDFKTGTADKGKVEIAQDL